MLEARPSLKRFRPRLRIGWLNVVGVVAIVLAATAIVVKNLPAPGANQILNVSYDPTRELYAAIDQAFVSEYRVHTGITLDIKGSHGGSGDLIKNDVAVVTPNPRTSGNGELSVLAAWGSVTTRGGSQAQAAGYVNALLQHVAVSDAGARGAATSFALAKIGDVQLTWENEALREVAANKDDLQLVYPPVSILAEPAVAWVDANVTDPTTATYAKAYLHYLFTDAAQEQMAQYGYRPFKPEILAKHRDRLPPVALFPVSAVAKDWSDAREQFFGTTESST